MTKDKQLCWVLINNELHHVKEFSHLKPNQRPVTYCPVCKRQVVLRLGDIRIFHAAHKPDDICAVTQPETALHLNTKLYIANQLRKHNSVFINQYCDGLTKHGCYYGNFRKYAYINGWDEVKVEYHIDQYQPDIVLLKNGKAIGAIEVLVTHSLEPEKECYLNKLSIPWIEVVAEKILQSDKNGVDWTADHSFIPNKINSGMIAKWVCSNCQNYKKSRIRKQQQQEIANQYQITAFRIVDFYYPDRKHQRSIYYASKREQNGKTTEIRIKDQNGEIASIENPTLPKDKVVLQQMFKRHIETYSNRSGNRVDTHMKWQVWHSSYSDIVSSVAIHNFFPRRFFWSGSLRTWRSHWLYFDIDWNNYFSELKQYKNVLREKQRIHELKKNERRIKLQEETIENKIEESYPQNNLKECMFCHTMTDRFWAYSNETGFCRCRDCYDRGIWDDKKHIKPVN